MLKGELQPSAVGAIANAAAGERQRIQHDSHGFVEDRLFGQNLDWRVG